MGKALAYDLKTIASHLDAKLIGDASKIITGIASLDVADEQQLTFITKNNFETSQLLKHTKAGVIISGDDVSISDDSNWLIVKNPRLAFAKAAELFNHKKIHLKGIHPSAAIAKDSKLAETAVIGANVCIGHNSFVGENTIIKAGAVIGDDVIIGANCIIHEGAVIGSDGFGNANDNGVWFKVPQLGGVIIHDDVEIGANSTIDCGAIGNTIIHKGVRIDNLVQIAHNVEIGEHTAIAAQSGIAGSTIIGKYCMLAGQSAVNGHVQIADYVTITGQGMITTSIKEPGVYSSGTGYMSNNLWRKMVVRLRGLDEMIRRVKKLEKIVVKGEK